MAGWDAAYDQSFKFDHYYTVIPTIPIEDFRRHLNRLVDTANSKGMELHEFDAFQECMQRREEQWGDEVFSWIRTSAKLAIKVNLDALQDDPRRYALVYEAIENLWSIGMRRKNIPCLPMLGELVDQY